jgi:hypothetical protein
MSDTPLTDAASYSGYAGYKSATDFARELEHKLNDCIKERDELRNTVHVMEGLAEAVRESLREMLSTLVAEGPNEGNIICDSKQITRWRKAAGI